MRVSIIRGLRLRLTLSYIFFFTVVLIALGFVFRQSLNKIVAERNTALLDEEWAAVKGYLRIERNNEPHWFFDREDPEEAFIVERLQRIHLLTDLQGNVMEVSNGYRALGVESPEEIRALVKDGKVVWKTRYDSRDDAVLVRYAILVDGGKSYFLALGRRLEDSESVPDQFIRTYSYFLPVLIAVISLIGWFMAKRALQPVVDVAQMAQQITSRSLNVRLPLRGAGDELDHLIERFNSMMERLEANFAQIRQFSTDVSHELRTPLTAVRGQLEVALITAKTVEEHREAMENALQDVERLSQIVRALLQLSQAESGQLSLHMTPVNLAAIVEDITDQFQIPAEDERVTLTAEFPPEAQILGDRIQIERLLYNLLSNAIKYTPAGGSVMVTVAADGASVRLIVADTGQGIAAEYLPHIFDRFYRVPGKNDAEKGLGLGLSFVSWIVKAHNATIDVESEAGKGTRFIVTFPRPASEGSCEPLAASD